MSKIDKSHPLDLIAMDLILLPKSGRGDISCLVELDHLFKWLSIDPIRHKLTSLANNVLTNNVSGNRSELFNDVLGHYSNKHIYSTHYKPSSNGVAELCSRTVNQFLRCVGERLGSWGTNLSATVMDYNHTSLPNLIDSFRVHHEPPTLWQ